MRERDRKTERADCSGFGPRPSAYQTAKPGLRPDPGQKPDLAEKKICGLIGLAARAGRIKSGEFATEASIKSKKAFLCIIAEDASDRTRKHFSDMCSYREIPLVDTHINKDTLGHAVGRDERAVLTIEDAGFSRQIIGIVKGGNACGK